MIGEVGRLFFTLHNDEFNYEVWCKHAGSASLLFITFGSVKWDYGALMIATGFVVTVAGQKMTHHIIKTFGRRSIVVVALAVLLSAGALIMIYEIFPVFLDAAKHGWFHVSRICPMAPS
jgi:hypothetical protein